MRPTRGARYVHKVNGVVCTVERVRIWSLVIRFETGIEVIVNKHTFAAEFEKAPEVPGTTPGGQEGTAS